MNNTDCSSSTYIGIDVSKSSLDFYVQNKDKFDQVKNQKDGFRSLLGEIQKLSHPVAVLEATGGYKKEIACYLQKHGINVAIVNPQRVREFAKGMGQLAKTDKLDARIIAEYGEKANVTLMCQWNEEREKLRALIHRKHELKEQRKSEKRRCERINDTWILRSHKRMIDFIGKNISALDKQIDFVLSRSLEILGKVNLLTTIPGIGKNLALLLAIELPELGQCNRKEIAMLSGLAPINHDSGNTKGKRSIHGGRKIVRDSLYMPTLSAIKCNYPIRALRNRLREKQKPGKVVVVACMRKLLTIANAVTRDQRPWSQEVETHDTGDCS